MIHKREMIAGAIIVMAVVVVFGQSIMYPFLEWDDHIFVLHANVVNWFDISWGTRLMTPHAGYPVPLPTAIHGVLHQVVGQEQAWVFKLANIGFHVVNALLVYALFRRLKLAVFAAGAGALVWALHPVMAEPVAWATGLKDLVSMTGVLLALLGMTHLERDSRSVLTWLLLIVGPLVAMGGKPTGVVVGPMILAYAAIHFDWSSPTMKWGSASGIVWSAVGAGVVAVSFLSHDEFGGQETEVFSFGRVFLALETMLRNYLFPVNLSALYSDFPTGPEALTYIIGIVIVAASVAIIWRTRISRPLIALGLLWFAIAIAPVSNLIPLGRFVADSYLYTPSLGLVLAICGWLGMRSDRSDEWPKRSGAIGTAICLVILASLCAMQVTYWQDKTRLFEQAVERSPQQPMAYIPLGNAYFEEQRYQEAIEVFEALNKRFPEAPVQSTNWPMSYCLMGAIEQCQSILEYLLLRGRSDTAPMATENWRHLVATYALVCGRTDCEIPESIDRDTRTQIIEAIEMFEKGVPLSEVKASFATSERQSARD